MNSTQLIPYSLWLIPSEDFFNHLRDWINNFAQRFNTPKFIPHATLCSGLINNISTLSAQIDVFAQSINPVDLTVESIGQTDDYLTFFYIKLKDNDPQHVFKKAVASIDDAHLSKLGAHLSLIYSDDFTIDRNKLSQEIVHNLPQHIIFDSLRLVVPNTGNWLDVTSWDVKYSCEIKNSDKH